MNYFYLWWYSDRQPFNIWVHIIIWTHVKENGNPLAPFFYPLITLHGILHSSSHTSYSPKKHPQICTVHISPVLSQKKNGTIFRYDFVAGGQILPQKCLCDRTAKDTYVRSLTKNPLLIVPPPQKKTIALHTPPPFLWADLWLNNCSLSGSLHFSLRESDSSITPPPGAVTSFYDDYCQETVAAMPVWVCWWWLSGSRDPYPRYQIHQEG